MTEKNKEKLFIQQSSERCSHRQIWNKVNLKYQSPVLKKKGNIYNLLAYMQQRNSYLQLQESKTILILLQQKHKRSKLGSYTPEILFADREFADRAKTILFVNSSGLK